MKMYLMTNLMIFDIINIDVFLYIVSQTQNMLIWYYDRIAFLELHSFLDRGSKKSNQSSFR
jgi:hypothetical protein